MKSIYFLYAAYLVTLFLHMGYLLALTKRRNRVREELRRVESEQKRI